MKKRAFAVILAAAMSLQCLAVPALADETVPIDVENPLNQTTSSVYDQISTVGTTLNHENQTYIVVSETAVELTGIVNPGVSVEIPSVVTSIYGDDYNVTGIAANAFSGCDMVRSLAIPSSVTSISFEGAMLSGLTDVSLADNTVYYVRDNAIYARGDQGDTLVQTLSGYEESLNQLPEDTETPAIEDGLYYFELFVSPTASDKYVMDISNGAAGMVNDANVDIYLLDGQPLDAQLFNVTSLGGDTYSIKPYVAPEMSLDCQMRSASVGANIRLMPSDDSLAQQFVAVPGAKEGYYTFKTANGKTVLSVGKVESGANVYLNNQSDQSYQEWKPVKVAEPAKKTDAVIENGWYNISTKANASEYLKIAADPNLTADNANLCIGTHSITDDSTYFYVEKVADGEYSFTPWVARTMRIDSYAGSYVDGTNLKQHTQNKTAAQRFRILETDTPGYYEIKSTQSSACVSVEGAASDNANAALKVWTNADTQKWKFDLSDRHLEDTDLAAGYYTIHTGVGTANSNDASKPVATITSEEMKNSTNIALAALNTSGDTQQFFIEPLGGSKYRVYSQVAYRALNMAGGKPVSGSNVVLYDIENKNNEIWTIKKDMEGYYRIYINMTMADGSLLAMEAADCKNAVGTNVQVSSETFADRRQQWVIKETTMGKLSAGYYDFSSARVNDRSRVIDIPSSDSTKALQLYKRNETAAQKFTVKAVSGGYNLVSIGTGKYIASSGGKVTQTSSAYLWQIVPNSDGTFSLKDQSGLYIYTTGTDLRTQLTMSSKTDAGARWYLTKNKIANGWQTIEGKIYYYQNNAPLKNTYVGTAFLGSDGVLWNGWKKATVSNGVISAGYRYYFDGKNGVATDARPWIWKSTGVWKHINRPGTKTINTNHGYSTREQVMTIPDGDCCLYIDTRNCQIQVFMQWPGESAYTVPVFGFKISPGKAGYDTETGVSHIRAQANWTQLGSPAWGGYCWGQYTSLINLKDGEYIHSVATTNRNTDNLDAATYNTLGTRQSHGCMRAAVRNAYWVYAFLRWDSNAEGAYHYTMTYTSAGGYPVRCKIVPQPRMTGALPIDPTDPLYTNYYEYYDAAKENSYYGPIFWS